MEVVFVMMRCGDIRQGPAPTTLDVTPDIYIPASSLHPVPVEEFTDDQLRRGLCQKSGGSAEVCKTCPGGCRFGREMVRRLGG